MKSGAIILCEGVLSLGLPLAIAVLELRALRGGGSGPPEPPDVPPPVSDGSDGVAPTSARARVLEDA